MRNKEPEKFRLNILRLRKLLDVLLPLDDERLARLLALGNIKEESWS